MYTPELILAMQCQAAVVAVAVLISTLVLKIPFQTALWAGALFNSIPITTAPGFETQLFLHDLLMPVLAVVTVVGRLWSKDRVLWLVAVTALVWPMVGTTITVSLEVEGYQWVTFLFRRFGFIVFFLAGLSALAPKVKAAEFFDACVMVWLMMLVPALIQYFGFIDTDIHPVDMDDLRGESIWESTAAQRGFLGLNRGAVGVWGSAVATYCLAQFLLSQSPGTARWITYVFGAVFSYVVIFFSGTRTGLLAAVGGAAFVTGRLLFLRSWIRPGRIIAFGSIACLAGIYLLGPVLFRIVERFNVEAAATGTGQSRMGVQAQTVDYIVRNWRASLLGMGASEAQFYALVGEKTEDLLVHPHSEFIESLWHGGFPGLALYLGLLYAFYTRMKVSQDSPAFLLGVTGQSVLVAGMISGLAVGNIFITSPRLATFGLVMAFTYGRIIRETRIANEAFDSGEAEEEVLEPAIEGESAQPVNVSAA